MKKREGGQEQEGMCNQYCIDVYVDREGFYRFPQNLFGLNLIPFELKKLPTRERRTSDSPSRHEKAQSSLAKPSKAVPDTDEIVADSRPLDK